ncbi:MAG TPA: class I adenylate-forming enzyme family protein [Syntrophorhabdales bacterium]|nr:class I adenylate-forming enzyme family protein [Syntrophorhabdales bacterium]
MNEEYKDWAVIIEERGRTIPEKKYIESLDQGKSITYGRMNEFCDRVGQFLRERKTKASDRVTIIGKNSIETMIIYYGVLKYGAVVNPIFFEESQENLYRIISMVRPRFVFYDSGLKLDTGRYAGEWIRFSDKGEKVSENDFFRLLETRRPVPVKCVAKSSDVALIVYTSGTMTLPKGIHISREGLFYMVDEIADRTGMTESDRVLEYRAYNWASAQLLTILSTMLKGATLFLARKFSRSRFPEWLKVHKITISSGVPAVINMLINEPVALRKEEVPDLKFITSSSAPLSVESHVRFEQTYHIPIQQMMGMSEAGWMVGNPPARRKLGSVGLPLKHKEICFLNEQGQECKPGEAGEMIVKGRAMGLCYSKEDGTIEAFPREGFPTGDLGYVDVDGYIFITGRKKDLIIRGGINISPMEITSRIMEHEGVSEAATIGVPDSIYGEEVVSFVVKKEGCELCADEIAAHCSRTLPDFKVPKKILFTAALPRSERGKVLKSELLRLYEKESSR